MNENKFTLTKQGLENLQNELKFLLETERPQVLEDIASARAFGDLSENADYDAARNKQSEIEGKILRIDRILKNSVIVEFSKSADKVSFGNYVEISDLVGNEVMVFQIVGSVEADPLNGTIADTSPLAESIFGKKIGERAIVKVAQPYEVEILRISTEKFD